MRKVWGDRTAECTGLENLPMRTLELRDKLINFTLALTILLLT